MLQNPMINKNTLMEYKDIIQKHRWIIPVCIICFLILSNPSPERYEQFSRRDTESREYDFFICSIYQDIKIEDGVKKPVCYLGIALNFIKI